MKTTRQHPIYLEIDFDDEENLQQDFGAVLQKLGFVQVIKTELYDLVKTAVSNKEERFIAFRLPAYNQDLIVEKKYYKNLLNTILEMYQADEDYLECASIKRMVEEGLW